MQHKWVTLSAGVAKGFLFAPLIGNAAKHRSDAPTGTIHLDLCESGSAFPVRGKEKRESDGELHRLTADLKLIFTVATQRTQSSNEWVEFPMNKTKESKEEQEWRDRRGVH